MNKKISYSIIGLVSILVIIGTVLENIPLLVHSLSILFLHNIAYSFSNIKKNVVFLMFNVTFFIFLLGRIFVSYYFGYNPNATPIGLDFSEESLLIDILLILILSLTSYFIAYSLSDAAIKNRHFHHLSQYNYVFNNKYEVIKKYSFYIMLVTFAFRLLNLIDIFIFVRNYGYTSYYITYEPIFPGFVGIIGSLFAVSFFIHIASLNTVKEAIIPLSLYFVEGFVSLLTGQRNMFALNVLIILIFIILVSKPTALKSLSRKYMFISAGVILAIPFVFIAVGNIRWGIESNQSVGQSFLRLFFDQGVSANLLGYTRVLEESIPENRFYSFGAIIRLAKRIGSIFFEIETYSGQTVEHAIYGHSFTYAITYLIMPDSFVQGRGYGSTYIAELLHDFNYVGVIVGNIVYGIFTKILMVTQDSIIFVKAFGLLTIRHFLFTPRAGFIDFLTYVFSPINMGFVTVFIIFLYRQELILYFHSKRGLNENN